MGCDGYIKQTDQPVKVQLTCYSCGKPIVQGTIPNHTHQDCVKEVGLKVDVEIENYEPR